MKRTSLLPTLCLALALATPGCTSGPPKPGQEAFEQASEQLTTFKDKVGFGNDEALARAFAGRAKQIDDELFSGGASKIDAASSQGKWMTHVNRGKDTTLFMVRVPLLKTYKGDDRKALMTDVLWKAAQEVAPEDLEKGNVVIAARGALAYGGIAQGKLDGDPSVETGPMLDTTPLYVHFAPAAQ